MKLSHEACSQVAHLVMGGSAVLVGCGTAGAVPAAIGGTALAALWLNSKRKTGADSQAALKKVTKVVERNWIKHDDYDFTVGLDIKAASEVLVAALPEIRLTPAEVARTATKHNEEGFPNAATALIVDRLMKWCMLDGRSERLFELSPKAKLFVETVFNLAFAVAIEDRNYFEQFEPHLLVDIAGYVGDTNRRVVALGDVLREEAEKTRAHVTDEVEALRNELLAELRNQRKTSELPEALLAALAERTDASLSLENQVSDLISRFDAAQEIIREGSAPSNVDAFVKEVQKRVADKMLAGDLDGADTEAEDAFTQWEREEAERAESAQRNGVALIETAIETALARGDAEAVARREMRKIALTVPEAARFEAARIVQDEYDKRGQTYGARIDLQIAVALAREYGQTDDRFDWANAKNDLAIVLKVLGERGQDGALDEAVTAYRGALDVYTREAAPMYWAMTQNNLGNVLQLLGARGQDGALDEAVTAYRAALEVRTREAAPTDWAMTQNNLGTALKTLGERGQDGALEKAVTAYRAAMEVYIREAAPMDWAMTQNNLGNVLQTLGERVQDGGLEEAVTAYRAALEVYTREIAPMDWAMMQNNLGNVLQLLGARGQDGALEEAVDAFRAALDVRTREAAPMDWAMTQNNLGGALQRLGERGQDGALEEAVTAYRAALEVYTRDAASMQWAMTQNNLGITLKTLGSRGQDGALEEAVDALSAALEVRTREAAPMDWALTQENLAEAFEVLADQGDNPRERLEAALEAVRWALEVFRAVGATYNIEIAELLEARVREKLGAL